MKNKNSVLISILLPIIFSCCVNASNGECDPDLVQFILDSGEKECVTEEFLFFAENISGTWQMLEPQSENPIYLELNLVKMNADTINDLCSTQFAIYGFEDFEKFDLLSPFCLQKNHVIFMCEYNKSRCFTGILYYQTNSFFIISYYCEKNSCEKFQYIKI